MRNTHLIFVEGIMGSGKSTTARFLTSHLQQNRIPAHFMPEGPTRDQLDHPLRVATSLPHPHAVWRDVTVDEYVQRSLGKWSAFVRQAQSDQAVTVCDGLLFHGNMTDLLLMDAPLPTLRRYVVQVIECVYALRPVVVYFRHEDIARALRALCDARGPTWEAYQVNWKLAGPYAVRRLLRGFDGLVRLYQVYCALCDDLFAQLPLPKLAIRNEGDWAAYQEQILGFLQLPAGRPSGGEAS